MTIVSPAVVGLIGVVIGGVLTGGVEFVLERSRERRRGKAAARLIHDALTDVDGFIKMSLVRRAWLGDPATVLNGAPWVEHRSLLAEAPGFDGWYPVAGAWGWINQLRRLVELFDEDVASDPMENRDQAFFEIGLLLVGIADKALSAYANTKSYQDSSAGPSVLQDDLAMLFEQASEGGVEGNDQQTD